MTQQPYYPPQQGYPQQPAPHQYQAPAPQQGYQPQFPGQGYAPQPYGAPQGQPYGQAPAPTAPLASGTLDDFYSQPSAGGGPAISWSVNGMPKPEGTSYVGIVARDVQASDIQQQTDPKSGQPKFYRDGRPQFVMKVPLKLQASQEFPEGEGVLFVRGQMRDELVRAMTEANAGRDPKGGDVIQVTLVQRKPSRGGGMPMNVFQIRYQAANPGQPQAAVSGAPSPAPEAAQPIQQYAPQPAAQPLAQAPVAQAPAPQFQQPVPQVQAPQFQAPAQPAQPQVPQQFAPQPVQQGAPQPPAGLDQEQQALIARLTAGQPVQQGA